MKFLFLNYDNKISPIETSAALRAGILLGEATYLAGDSSSLLYYDRYLEGLSTKEKLLTMISFYKGYRAEKKVQWMSYVYEVIEAAEKIKHPRPESLLNKNKALRNAEQNFEIFKDWFLSIAGESGIFQLRKMSNKTDMTLMACDVDSRNPETKEGKYNRLSSLLLLESGMTREDIVMLLLTDQFLTAPMADEAQYLDVDISLPNLITIVPEEMKLIRKQLLPERTAWWNALTAWYWMLLKEPENEDGVLEKAVVDAAEKLRTALLNNRTVQMAESSPFSCFFRVKVGKITQGTAFDYFRHMNMIPDVSWDILNIKRKDHATSSDLPLPFILIRLTDEEGNPFQGIGQEVVDEVIREFLA